jgi:hypothetical protein
MKPNKLTDEEKKERKRLYGIEYRKKNADKIKEYKKSYNQENADKIKEYDKKRYDENREEILKQQKIKRDFKKRVYSDEQKLAKKLYRENNKVKLNEQAKLRNKKRRKEDPLFKLKNLLSCRLNEIFRQKGFTKKSRTHEILGCTFEVFKQHLESQFEDWMTWDNHGLYNGELNYGWDIDHIIPTSSADTEEELIKLNHYTNLKPLCSKVNRHIKKDK